MMLHRPRRREKSQQDLCLGRDPGCFMHGRFSRISRFDLEDVPLIFLFRAELAKEIQRSLMFISVFRVLQNFFKNFFQLLHALFLFLENSLSFPSSPPSSRESDDRCHRAR